MRILLLLILACLPAPLLAQPEAPAQPPRTAPPTDAECFLIAAVGADAIRTDQSLPAEARRMGPVLDGTANYFAGRLSMRLSPAELPTALAAAAPAVSRPDRGQLVISCTTAFRNFMQATRQAPAQR